MRILGVKPAALPPLLHIGTSPFRNVSVSLWRPRMPPDLIHRRRWWTLEVLSISLVVISLDNTILNVALPSIAADLGASPSQLQWIVDAYMLVFAGTMLTAGALGDRFGRKRALMGIGGALIMPSPLSILTAVFPAEERGKAIGAWAAVTGLGIAVGPVAGGWLVEHANWHWVFLVNLPIVALALGLGRFLVPESRDPQQARIDLPGAALSIAGLTALLWGLIEAPGRRGCCHRDLNAVHGRPPRG